MTNRPTFQEVYREFSQALGVRCCLAGGAIRDYLLGREPQDWDFFCLEPYDRSRLDSYDRWPTQPKSYGAFHVLNLNWRGEKVQIVNFKRARTVNELLDTFDWSICQHAYDGERIHSRVSVEQMQPGCWMRLCCPDPPASSLRRGIAFEQRYGVRMSHHDRFRLEAMIAIANVAAVEPRRLAVAA